MVLPRFIVTSLVLAAIPLAATAEEARPSAPLADKLPQKAHLPSEGHREPRGPVSKEDKALKKVLPASVYNDFMEKASKPPKAGVPLTAEQMKKAYHPDEVTIPSPGELMAALNKESKPTWQTEYRPPIPTLFSSRAQIALNIGGLVADGYIALEAEDGQQIKNIGKDIITLSKSLAVSENVVARGKSIVDFAENNEWNALKEELESTQNEVKLALIQQQDSDLVYLVSLGGWIRGTAAVSSWIATNYTPAAAELLRQPGIVALMRDKLRTLPEKIQSDPLVREIADKLVEIEALVSFPDDKPPSQDDVKRLQVITNKLVEDMAKKKDTK